MRSPTGRPDLLRRSQRHRDRRQPATGDGGWVQFAFHGICPSDCSDITTPAAEFDHFLTWLADQQTQGNLVVRTVGDVIGGDVAGPVSGLGGEGCIS